MRKSLLLVIIAVVKFTTLFSQTIDPSFQAPIPVKVPYIAASAKQSDGKILLGGDIAFFGNQPQHGIIRLNVDGSLDDTFSFFRNDEHIVVDIELTSSGDIIVLSRRYFFFNMWIHPESYLIKITANGAIQKEIGTMQGSGVLTIQNDDKILVGSASGNYLMRYNADFTEDTAFNEAVSVNGRVRDIQLTSDKLLVAGSFDTVNGETKNDIVKLNMDGSIDPSFDTGTGTNINIGAITIDETGKILLGDTYISEFNGHTFKGLARLNSDGSVDETFSSIPLNGPVSRCFLVGDKIYAAANWEYEYAATTDKLFRLNSADGSLDETFTPLRVKSGANLMQFVSQSDNQFIISHSNIEGSMFGISRIDNTGVYDETFAPEIGARGTIRFGDILNDKLLVAGDFIKLSGVETFGVARLNVDGTVDETFSLKEDNGAVWQLKVLNDNSVLVTTHTHFFKLDENGNKRTDFNWIPGGLLFQIVKFEVLDNGKIIVADPNTLARLNSDGSVDSDFDMGRSNSSTSFDFDMQGDSIIYGGTFSELKGISANCLGRVNSLAEVDDSFDIGSGPGIDPNLGRYISMVKVLDNNEILVGGGFTEWDGHAVSHNLVKLSSEGTLDINFNNNQSSALPPEPGSYYKPKVVQVNSKVYIKGVYGIYVVNVDGTVDDSFSIPATVEGLSDVITPNTVAEGRVKDDEHYLFAFGAFKNGNTQSQILKMIVKEETVLGTETLKDSKGNLSMRIYPQPVGDKLNIDLHADVGDFTASVYDLSGRKCLEQEFSKKYIKDVAQINIENTAPGFYIIKVKSSSGKTTFQKFTHVN